MDRVIQPITDAINAVEGFVKTLKDFSDSISLRRRLGEVAHAEIVHARDLKEQAHRQLEQVRGRLFHADNDHARDGTKERLLLDVNRRLEAHVAERKLVARRLARELITISNLKVSILFNLNSRMLIEGQVERDYLLPLAKEETDLEKSIPLPPTPFVAKLATSFSVDFSLRVKLEGDLKALVHLVVNRMAVNFDLSTNAGERAVLSAGDWTNIIKREKWLLSSATHSPVGPFFKPQSAQAHSKGAFASVAKAAARGCVVATHSESFLALSHPGRPSSR